MSSLSNLPYGKILDYWYEKLKGNPHLIKFLFTKTLEVFTFKSQSWNVGNRHNYFDFPDSINNSVPLNPKITLVIPVYLRSEKERQNVQNLLNSINNQKLLPSMIIIIDDCSPVKYDFPKSVNYFRLEKNSGPAKARNIGKRIALENGSDVIAFTDSDCILCENWVQTIANTFVDDRKFQILSGNTPSFGNNWFGLYHNINGTLNGRKIIDTDRLLYGTTANLAMTKSVAELIHFNEMFPIAAGEDIEFCFRANRSRFAIKYVSNMIIYHNYGYTGQLFHDIKLFHKQFKRYGQGEKVLLSVIPNYYAYFDKTIEINTIESPLTNGVPDPAVVS